MKVHDIDRDALFELKLVEAYEGILEHPNRYLIVSGSAMFGWFSPMVMVHGTCYDVRDAVGLAKAGERDSFDNLIAGASNYALEFEVWHVMGVGDATWR